MADPFSFSLLDTCSGTKARRGQIATPHGGGATPAFMPVGTAASVKGLSPAQVKDTGSEILLANTYHLALRPGDDVVRDLGGLHAFMQWDGPILTDSGGYQVFSLCELTDVDDEGVTFRNHIDGKHLRLTPERTMEIQLNLGSDIIMVFDECLPHDASSDTVRRSIYERTLPWSERCLDLHPGDGRALFAISQGGVHAELRSEHLDAIRGSPFDGFAIGGLSVGETTTRFREIVAMSTALMPTDKPRYLMGVGSVPEIIDAVALGIDMFDCVLPSRNARNGQGLTFEGIVRLKNSCYAKDARVIDETCTCATCAGGFTRAYLRHLVMAKELLGASLMTLHNLTFMQRLMSGIRGALSQARFPDWREATLAMWGDGRQ
ncbi:MAG: tRNA guanosine(34) transglycosylase Tgt [Planctomycetes bacterium]|nr:tRNA guanosine(34) transglycosylase Tgt [Planctomycetota bacterium]